MKKLYAYFCLFFMGSLLPFIIVEFYFQDLTTIGILIILAIVVLAFCISIENLRIKKDIDSSEKINYVNLIQNRELNKRPSFYFFRKRFW